MYYISISLLSVDALVLAVADSQTLQDAVYSTNLVDNIYLRIDVVTMKESLNCGEILAVKRCSSNMQLSNCLVKRIACLQSLWAVSEPIHSWI